MYINRKQDMEAQCITALQPLDRKQDMEAQYNHGTAAAR